MPADFASTADTGDKKVTFAEIGPGHVRRVGPI